MAFHSILFESPEDGPPRGTVVAPEFFGDLNLDQVVGDIVRGYDEYDLVPFFRTELKSERAVTYRHDVMRDLDRSEISAEIQSFTLAMRKMRASLEQAEQLHYPKQKQWWFLEAASQYCLATRALCSALDQAALKSRGLVEFVEWLRGYLGSASFDTLQRDVEAARTALDAVRYCLRVNGSVVTVFNDSGETDFGAHVLGLFERFRQGDVKDRHVELKDWPEMNHVEARVLDCAAELDPQPFARLSDFVAKHADFLDPTVATFDREIQFYVAYRGYIQPCREAGLAFAYPSVSSVNKSIRCDDTFDLALASKLCAQGSPVICNDLYLEGPERIFVVSGPNNGGKTTFARTFGQLHYLGRLGCPVPGTRASLFLYDRLFAHFEREENTADLRGKLQDDLMRMRDILARATPRSIILMNEIFSSTTLADAMFLCRSMVGRIIDLDALGVCVTFIEELARLGPQTVSMVSEIAPGDPSARTLRVRRRPADGRAYAVSIAEQYGLTYERLKERLAS
ncbi:DNA mismatch repair protein MutS [Paraburkholderia monticola]|uniref:DNA mismatch repair protein MutS n=1 Tax=Paraburkholderia monticola TaxID=1399968 RepID=A0A149PR49_9BURK|nr:DNA mismatch repair protein MutS [Paraburkholderia monticola]KXU87484.1 DNA mismatch repair protein MutS [Paraburkholderia monticola]